MSIQKGGCIFICTAFNKSNYLYILFTSIKFIYVINIYVELRM